MINIKRIPCLVSGFFIALALGFSSVLAASTDHDSVPQLHVRGESTFLVPADQVSVTLGVLTAEKTAKKATLKNSQKMQAIIAAIKKLGLTDKDYKTQNFRVQPVWSSRPNNANRDWRPKVVAYRVNNRLRVTTKKLEQMGNIIADTLASGANQVDSVIFSLSDPRQHRQQAITDAMNNAKEDAQALVAASGDAIKRTLSLHLDNTSATPKRVQLEKTRTRLMSADAAVSAVPPPVDAGDITVRASVSVIYELEP